MQGIENFSVFIHNRSAEIVVEIFNIIKLNLYSSKKIYGVFFNLEETQAFFPNSFLFYSISRIKM